MKSKNLKLLIFTTFIILVALTRFIPHSPNFTPLLAIALFSGYFFENKKLAFIIPFAAMFISDIFLGFHSAMYSVYLSFGLIILLGFLIKSNKSFLKITISSVAASLIFFIVTNFGVWLSFNLYPTTLSGLLLCYEAAIPFFRNTLLSTFLFSGILFGSVYLYEVIESKNNLVKVSK